MKKMLKKENGRIDSIMLVLIGIGLIFVIAIIIGIVKGNQKDTSNEVATNVVVEPTKPTIEGNQYVSESNGLKVNTSNKLTEDKTFGIYTFKNIKIQTDANGSVILANVSADSTTKTEGKIIKIKIVDENGKTLETLGGYIGQIKPGETNSFRAETTTDITNAYDFIIE